MILKVNDIIPIVQGFLDDPDADFATEKYLLPKFQAAQNRLIITMLEDPNIGEIVGIAEVFNVAVGTQSLQAAKAMDPGQPFELLKSIITLEEKITGFAMQEYARLTPTRVLPNVVPGALNQMYAWIGQDIKLLGATSALDFRVFGVFEPQVLTSGDSSLVPGTAAIIQYRVAEIVCAVRGNFTLAKYYKDNADEVEDQHYVNLIKAQQSIPTRQKSYPRAGYDLRYI